MKRLLPLVPLAALLLTTMGIGPCDSKPLGSVQGCTYQGADHPVGSSWGTTGSRCESCACTDTGPVCTSMTCADAGGDAGATCFDNIGNIIACPTDAGDPDSDVPDAIVGSDGPGMDAPDTCFDASGNVIPCQTDGGPVTEGGPDGMAASSCVFDATYVYGWVGGLQAFADLMTLAPPASYAIVRTPAPGNTLMGDSGSCAPALPACGSGNGKTIDVPEILADIADPTVQLLLSLTTTQTLTLGMRLTADDSLFSFQKNGSPGFLVGSSCLGDVGNCTPIPDSVAKLRTDLIALDKQQRLDPACAGPLSTGD